MEILALDGSTHSTGWAIFNDATLCDYGCITATSSDVIKRIEKMQKDIQLLLTNHSDITKVIMEEVRPDQGFQNLKTHKALMYLQAAITFLIHDDFPAVTIEMVYPSSWRKQCGIKTGSGIKRASLKQADIAFVQQQFKITVNDDVADAIGIGYASTQNESAW